MIWRTDVSFNPFGHSIWHFHDVAWNLTDDSTGREVDGSIETSGESLFNIGSSKIMVGFQ